jgi:hypothetical protein
MPDARQDPTGLTCLWTALRLDAPAGRALWSREEQPFVDGLLRALGQFLAAHGVAPTPLLALRVQALVLHAVQAARLEATLSAGALVLWPEPDSRGRAALNPAVEAAAKERERMRKAIKELEDACQAAGTPIHQGLPDHVRDLLAKTAGITHAVCETGGRREDRGACNAADAEAAGG